MEETHYYPFGLTMAGISSKAAEALDNKNQYNGIESNKDLGLNMYDAFYRNLDPQTGRFWQIDPETESLEDYSPYASRYNNPICNVDPLGDFGTRFGAWLYKLFHGGGTVGENSYGEYYVQKVTISEDGSATVSVSYGKGRDMYSNAREALARDEEVRIDIWKNSERSMYEMYDSPQKAGNAALSIGTGMLLPNPIVRSATITINTAKASTAAKKMVEKLLNAGRELDKAGLSAVGRALQKHGGRAGSVFPKAIGNPTIINAQGETVLKDIITNPSVSTVTRYHARFGNILEYKLPNGQGARFSADGNTFIGFIEQ